ncbi:MAG: hypothetical protein FWC23_03430 [Chitinispirillia bacterium]|nr:hypothetical protein [Chitinispirillia bacterium]MCL2268226.1 hypothetical protein [Chitinispirillia bacterium]
MNINSIGSSAASWAQFVKISQAARERNGLQPDLAGGLQNSGAGLKNSGINNAGGVQDVNIASFKKAFNVYSEKLVAPVPPVTGTQAPPSISKSVGGMFDAYA